MVYVISDIHGEYEKFLRLLERIEFCDSDELYILGDIIDRGPEPIKLLQHIMTMPNAYLLLGNHEVVGADVLRKLAVEITQENADTHIDADTMLDMIEWQQNGGEITMKQFAALSTVEREDILDFFEEFGLVEVVDVNEKTFVLVHAGLNGFSEKKKFGDYTLAELTQMRPDYEKRYFADPDVYIISGHTPTMAVSGKWEIYRSHNNILIDCGAAFGGRLACLCLDTDEEFYV